LEFSMAFVHGLEKNSQEAACHSASFSAYHQHFRDLLG